MRQFHIALPATEVGDLTDDVRRLFDEIERGLPPRGRFTQGDCTPPLDVLETDEAIVIVIDLPGLSPSAVRVLFKAGIVMVAGQKSHPDTHQQGSTSFHLVERSFGRFVRAIRVTSAVDAGRAQARMCAGELRLVLPKIGERRGRPCSIAIEAE